MEVRSQLSAQALTGVPVSQSRPVGTSGAKRDVVTIDGTQAVETALARTPDSRAAEVERAKVLLAQVRWPPEETIRRISELLGIQIEAETASDESVVE